MRFQHIVGIDEAGRGPLAGPVAVGVVLVPVGFNESLVAGVGDSKKIAPKNREAIFGRAVALRRDGVLDFRVALVGAPTIDRIGIAPAVTLGMRRALSRLSCDPSATEVKLDGCLTAPAHFLHQETIIKGDGEEWTIGLASILAKVTRDRCMARLGAMPQAAPYNFATHKGYGTAAHRAAIQKHGLLPGIHRATFCRSIILPAKPTQ